MAQGGLTLSQLQGMGAKPVAAPSGGGMTAAQLQSQGAQPITPSPAPAAAPSQPQGDLFDHIGNAINSVVPGGQLGGAIGTSLNAIYQAIKQHSMAPIEQGNAENNANMGKVLGDTAQTVLTPASMLIGGPEGAGILPTLGRVTTNAGLGGAIGGAHALASGKTNIGDIAAAAGTGAALSGGISGAAEGISKAAKPMGNILSQILGASTGAGASSIKAAAGASPEFTAAMRGQISPDEVVQSVQDAVQNIKQARGDAYVSDLAKIGENGASHDITPIVQSVQDNLKRFNIGVNDDGSLDFSRSSIANNGSARADVQGVFDSVKNWGSQEGDRTAVGLDTLKKQLSDFYSPSGQARAFVASVKSSVSDLLNNNVPGYKDMTAKYAQTSQLLDDIKSATAIGGKAKSDTIFTKLSQAMKSDKEFRLQVLNEIQNKSGDSSLMDKIAGVQLSPAIPRGLVGRGVDISAAMGTLFGHFNPEFLPVLLSTSPRAVGEFVRALGLSGPAANGVLQAVNKLAPLAPYLSFQATPQANQTQEQQQP